MRRSPAAAAAPTSLQQTSQRRRAAFCLLALALVLAGPHVVVAQTKCSVAKIRAARKGIKKQMICVSHAKAAAVAPDPACIADAQAKTDTAVTNAGSCTGSIAAIESAISACVAQLTLDVPGDGECPSKSAKIVGKRAGKLLGCEAKQVLKPGGLASCDASNDNGLATSLANKGGCASASAIHAHIHECSNDIKNVVSAGAVTVPDFTWTWVSFSDATCRDGSSAGIGVNLNSASTKVLIYLQGGGACADPVSCPGNPSSFGSSDFDAQVSSPGQGLNGGIFYRGGGPLGGGGFPQNPFEDWNQVFVPYCTGDWHAGNNPNGNVPGVGPQIFVGYTNIGKFLARLVPTFPNATHVFMTGVSAGGAGSFLNYDHVSRAFGAIPVVMLDDAVPPMTNTYLTACSQTYTTSLWGLDATIQTDCGGACSAGNGSIEFAQFLAEKYPGRTMGYLTSMADINMRNYFAGGLNNCTGGPFTAEMWAAAVNEMRAILQPYPNVATFFFEGEDHTSMLTLVERSTSGGEKLSDWVTALIDGNASHQGP